MLFWPRVFIDLHTHVFNHPLFRHGRLAADRIGVRQGVACVVDAGSSGTSTIARFSAILFMRHKQRKPTRSLI
ncbi:MAG: hypothetical protein CM1200mP24_08770 [Gammaproteobacteria bacterium]|nr:MAG: hypothetical protein CM1200mP24_08770 [Gammaproteobacteria bacterium]